MSRSLQKLRSCGFLRSNKQRKAEEKSNLRSKPTVGDKLDLSDKTNIPTKPKTGKLTNNKKSASKNFNISVDKNNIRGILYQSGVESSTKVNTKISTNIISQSKPLTTSNSFSSNKFNENNPDSPNSSKGTSGYVSSPSNRTINSQFITKQSPDTLRHSPDLYNTQTSQHVKRKRNSTSTDFADAITSNKSLSSKRQSLSNETVKKIPVINTPRIPLKKNDSDDDMMFKEMRAQYQKKKVEKGLDSITIFKSYQELGMNDKVKHLQNLKRNSSVLTSIDHINTHNNNKRISLEASHISKNEYLSKNIVTDKISVKPVENVLKAPYGTVQKTQNSKNEILSKIMGSDKISVKPIENLSESPYHRTHIVSDKISAKPVEKLSRASCKSEHKANNVIKSTPIAKKTMSTLSESSDSDSDFLDVEDLGIKTDLNKTMDISPINFIEDIFNNCEEKSNPIVSNKNMKNIQEKPHQFKTEIQSKSDINENKMDFISDDSSSEDDINDIFKDDSAKTDDNYCVFDSMFGELDSIDNKSHSSNLPKINNQKETSHFDKSDSDDDILDIFKDSSAKYKSKNKEKIYIEKQNIKNIKKIENNFNDSSSNKQNIKELKSPKKQPQEKYHTKKTSIEKKSNSNSKPKDIFQPIVSDIFADCNDEDEADGDTNIVTQNTTMIEDIFNCKSSSSSDDDSTIDDIFKDQINPKNNCPVQVKDIFDGDSDSDSDSDFEDVLDPIKNEASLNCGNQNIAQSNRFR